MPLQNRVDPFGAIHAEPQRAALMGNRGGRLHDPETKTLLKRRWASKAWIICLCDFKGRQRKVMGRSYTELFFLDEATALAAGHRPCFECQRERAKAFAACFAEGNGLASVSAPEMDAILHRERLAPCSLLETADKLPDGAMVADGGGPALVAGGRLLAWSFEGYRATSTAPGSMRLLTPPSTVRALAAGFQPLLHHSAAGT